MPHVELPQAEFKVVMLGDSDAGKTSLVLRFAEGYYRDRRSSTVGAFFITKRIQTANGITCKIQIWDTAGQAQFRPMAPMYYRNAAAAIVCYDVTSAKSYKVMTEWLDELHRNVPAGSIVIAIAATKCDRIRKSSGGSHTGQESVTSPESQHQQQNGQVMPHDELLPALQPAVPLQEVQALAQTVGAIYVATSAKDNHGVTDLYQRVAERVLRFRRQSDAGMQPSIPMTPGAVANSSSSKSHHMRSRSGSISQYLGKAESSVGHTRLISTPVRVTSSNGKAHGEAMHVPLREGSIGGDMDTYHFDSIPGSDPYSASIERLGLGRRKSDEALRDLNGMPLAGEERTTNSNSSRGKGGSKEVSMCANPFMCGDIFLPAGVKPGISGSGEEDKSSYMSCLIS